MRRIIPRDLEAGRIRTGRLATTPEYGVCGAFKVRSNETSPILQRRSNAWLVLIGTDGTGGVDGAEEWEHVSVHVVDDAGVPRLPTWNEMRYVKEMFWEDDENVVQFHPTEDAYVNIHEYVLHLWRWKKGPFPTPPKHTI